MYEKKEKYSKLELELITFDNEDVISASDPDEGEWDPAD